MCYSNFFGAGYYLKPKNFPPLPPVNVSCILKARIRPYFSQPSWGEFPTTALVAVICPKDPITPTPPHLGLRKDIKASKFRFGGGTNAGWMATTPTEILLVAFLETCRVITLLFTSNKARPYCITSHGACWDI